MKNLIKFIISSIIDQPQKLKITESQNDSGLINYQVSVAPEDMGKVIGKGGQIIQAIRNLCRIRGFKEGKKVTLNLLDPLRENTPYQNS